MNWYKQKMQKQFSNTVAEFHTAQSFKFEFVYSWVKIKLDILWCISPWNCAKLTVGDNFEFAEEADLYVTVLY